MAIYRIAGIVTVSCWTEVEAASESVALRIAQDRDLAEFHIDSTYPVNETWHLDSDGTPTNIRIDQ